MATITDAHLDLLGLCRIKGVGWHLIAREARRTSGLDRLWGGDVAENTREGSDARQALSGAGDLRQRLRADARAIHEQATSLGFQLTTVLDEDYPLNLRLIFNLPPFLFYLGQLDAVADSLSVAVVGTRNATPEGTKHAANLSAMLVENGVTVLSGLARGIDTAAHTAALAAGGRTVAVIGSGLSQIYPPENRGLAEEIARRGAVVSQFWPQTPPSAYNFPRRNVTMSGMAQGTAVVEASATSGAKMQARLALEHGKKVFLLQSVVESQEWARKYMGRGAIEVARISDILSALKSAASIEQRTRVTEQLALNW
jgi:DNA processing protein